MNPIRGPYPASGLRVKAKQTFGGKSRSIGCGFFGVRFSRGGSDAGDDADDISVFSCRGVVGEIRAEA